MIYLSQPITGLSINNQTTFFRTGQMQLQQQIGRTYRAGQATNIPSSAMHRRWQQALQTLNFGHEESHFPYLFLFESLMNENQQSLA